MVRRLVEAFEPVAIYLFGSRARGDADEDSDYDLMLVLADDRARAISRQAIWDTARSDRIDVNPFLTRGGGVRLAPTRGRHAGVRGSGRRHQASPDVGRGSARRRKPARTGSGSMNAKVVEEWLERVERDLDHGAESLRRG